MHIVFGGVRKTVKRKRGKKVPIIIIIIIIKCDRGLRRRRRSGFCEKAKIAAARCEPNQRGVSGDQ